MFTVKTDNGTRGLYVVFEGPDGSGKSTLSKLFVEALRNIAHEEDVVLQAFPTKDGEVGKLIRKTFTKEIELSEEVLGYLMVADGLDRCDLLYKQLEAGRTVVCDRHPMVSGWAYQAEVYTHDEVIGIQQRQRFMEPDIVFILDVPPEVAAQRMKARAGETNLVFEKDDVAYRTRLRLRYSGYASINGQHSVMLDGEQEPAQLLNTCLTIVREHFTAAPKELS